MEEVVKQQKTGEETGQPNMEEDDQLKRAYDRADQQRFLALKKALEEVDLYAAPIFDPEKYEQFDEMRKYLLEHYKPENTDWIDIMESPDSEKELSEN